MEYIPTLPPSGNFGRNLTNKQRVIILFLVCIPFLTGAACLAGFLGKYDKHSLVPYLLGFQPCQTNAELSQHTDQAVEDADPIIQERETP